MSKNGLHMGSARPSSNMLYNYIGYQGFRDRTRREYSSLKPGETYDQRDHKIQQMVHGGTQQRFRIGNDTYKSLYQQDYKSSGMITRRRMKPVHAEGMTNQKEEKEEKVPFQATTIYEEHYQSPEKDIKDFLKLMTSDFQSAFHAYCLKHNYDTEVPVRDVKQLLTDLLKRPASDSLLYQYEEMYRLQQKTEITWEDFQKATEEIQQQFIETEAKEEEEETTVRKKPAIQRSSIQSRYQRDYGTDPNDRRFVEENRLTRGAPDTVYAMASSTLDLNEGTNQKARTIPGYVGFKPAREANSSDLQENKQTRIKTNLSLYYRQHVPGYTGYEVKDAANFHK